VLRAPSTTDESNTLHLIESEAGCLEVMEAREALEPPVAAMAAEKSDEAAIEQLREILETMRVRAGENDFDAYFARQGVPSRPGRRRRESSRGVRPRPADRHDGSEGLPGVHAALLLEERERSAARRRPASEILDAVEDQDEDAAFTKMVEHWTRMREIWEA